MQFLSADFIFDGRVILPKQSVLVVSDDGRIADILENGHDVQPTHYTGMLMPGMVNAHCHLELSHMKGRIPMHTGLVDFLLGVNGQRHDVSEAEIFAAIQQAEEDMLGNGIVAVGDICNTANTLSLKAASRMHYHNFVECFGLLDANAPQRFQPAQALCEAFGKDHPSSVVLHAPYSVSNTLVELVNGVSAGKITCIHNQESLQENLLFEQGLGDFLKLFEAIVPGFNAFHPSGKSSLQTYLPKLNMQQHLVLVHNTVSSKTDIEFAKATGKSIYWCLCPNANDYIEQSLPDIPLMMEQDCCIVLGTDSLASNHTLNLLDEIRTIARHYPGIALEQMLHWATAQGAKALGMDAVLGSFEKDKRPGVVQVANMNTMTALPPQPDIRVIVKST